MPMPRFRLRTMMMAVLVAATAFGIAVDGSGRHLFATILAGVVLPALLFTVFMGVAIFLENFESRRDPEARPCPCPAPGSRCVG